MHKNRVAIAMAKIIGLRRKLVTMTKRSRVFQTVEVFALSLSIFVILATGTNAAAIDSPSNTNKQSAVANSSTNEKLIEKQNELEQSYQNTLLNASLLPFASECHDVMSPTSRVNSPMDKRLCAAYYDMMNNLHETRSTGYQSIDDVRVTLHEYDNSTLVNNFCSLFPGELPLEDNKRLFEKQLFPGGTPLGTDLKNETVKCNLYCFELVNSDMQLKPICKLISGGYRAIKLVSSSNVDIFKTNNEKKEKVDSSVIQPLNTHAEPETVKKENAKSVEPIHINAEPPPIHHPVPSVVSSTKPVANSHKPITPNKAVPVERVEQAEVPKKILETPKINTKIEETPQIQTEEEKPEKPQISKIDVVPKENPAKAAIQNKVDSDEYLPANNNDDENDYGKCSIAAAQNSFVLDFH